MKVGRIVQKSLFSEIARVHQASYHCTKARMSFWKEKKLFYECSPWSLLENEKKIIERSLFGGCNAILTTSHDDLDEIYQLLYDIQDPEVFRQSSLEIGHSLTLRGKETANTIADRCEKELGFIIKKVHKDQKLTFLTVQLPASDLKSLETVSGITTKLRSLCDSCHRHDVLIGFDFRTRTFHDLTTEDLQIVINNVSNLLSTDKHSFQIATIACNYMTLDKASHLMKSLRQVDPAIPFLGTEVLKIHPVIPGQLSTIYDYISSHRYQQQTLYSTELNPVAAALTDFNESANKCCYLENVMLEKYREVLTKANIPVSELCVGMALASSTQDFLFPEEWCYLREKKWLPNLKARYEEIGKINASLQGFSKLHVPHAYYMFSSFRNLLQKRILSCTSEIYSEFKKINPKLAEYPPELVTGMVAKLFKELGNVNAIGLSLTKLQKNEPIWDFIDNDNIVNHDQLLPALNAIMPSYNSSFFVPKKQDTK